MANSIQKNRLHKEIMDLERDPPPGITCYPKEDDITELEAYIKGPPDSPYEKGLFKLAIQIPDNYPFGPPQMKFVTKVYHPNIDDTGRICADILKSGDKGSWKPAINISTALMSLRQLLATPNPDDPLDAEIAKEYQLDYPTFLQNAREYTAKYASEEAVMNDDAETKDEKMEEAAELKNKDVDMDIIEEEELEEKKPKVSLSLSKKKGSGSNSSSQSISSQSVQSSLDNNTTTDVKPKNLLSKKAVKSDKSMKKAVDSIVKPQKIEKVEEASNIEDVENAPKIEKLNKSEKVKKLEEDEKLEKAEVKNIEAAEKVEVIKKVEKLKKPEISKKVKKVEKAQINAEQIEISTDDEFENVDKVEALEKKNPKKVEVGRRAEEIKLISDDEVVIVEKFRKVEQASKKIDLKKSKKIEDVEKSKKVENVKNVDDEVALEKIQKNRIVAPSPSSSQKKKNVAKDQDHAAKEDSTDKKEKNSALKENNVNKEEELEPVIIIKKHRGNVLNLSSQKLQFLPNLSFPPKREGDDQSNAIDLDSKLPKKETHTSSYFSSFTDNALQETKSLEINSNDKDVTETASSSVTGILSESTEMNICNNAKRSFESFLSQNIIELSDDDDDLMNSTILYHSLQLNKKTKRNKISLSKKKPSKDI